MVKTSASQYCQRILADADPVLLIRLVERIQSLNLIPEQFPATWLPGDCCAVNFNFRGRDGSQVKALADRVQQFVTVRTVNWGMRASTLGVPNRCSQHSSGTRPFKPDHRRARSLHSAVDAVRPFVQRLPRLLL